MINLNALIDSSITKCQINGKWYYSYDRKHYEPLMPRFDEIKEFSDDMAAVFSGYGWGYISLDGEIAIPIRYEYCNDFEQGMAVVSKGHKHRLIDKANNPITPWIDYLGVPLSEEGYRRIKIDGKWGFADVTGNVVLDPKYDYCLDFTEGLAAVESNKKWGYIDTTGKWVITPTYEKASWFHNGKARVLSNQKVIYIYKDGCEVTLNTEMKSDNDYSCFSRSFPSKTYTVFCDNGQWGVKDNKENVIVSPQFEDAKMLYENIVGVQWNNLWDIIHLK